MNLTQLLAYSIVTRFFKKNVKLLFKLSITAQSEFNNGYSMKNDSSEICRKLKLSLVFFSIVCDFCVCNSPI